jgi:hypothetical protein
VWAIPVTVATPWLKLGLTLDEEDGWATDSIPPHCFNGRNGEAKPAPFVWEILGKI